MILLSFKEQSGKAGDELCAAWAEESFHDMLIFWFIEKARGAWSSDKDFQVQH